MYTAYVGNGPRASTTRARIYSVGIYSSTRIFGQAHAHSAELTHTWWSAHMQAHHVLMHAHGGVSAWALQLCHLCRHLPVLTYPKSVVTEFKSGGDRVFFWPLSELKSSD